MRLFKPVLVLFLSATVLASCTVNINYPGSGIIEYLTADSNSDVVPDDPEDTVEDVTETDEPFANIEVTAETAVNEAPKDDTTAKNPPSDEAEPETNVHKTDEQITPIYLAYITSPISKGKTATVDIIGEPNTEYSIEVFYTSGKSSAKGLENKISNETGAASWSWKIGSSLKPGYYRIVITGGGTSLETEIQVY